MELLSPLRVLASAPDCSKLEAELLGRAVAAFHAVGLLLTWNFKHLANEKIAHRK
jgi:hypothetical protein